MLPLLVESMVVMWYCGGSYCDCDTVAAVAELYIVDDGELP